MKTNSMMMLPAALAASLLVLGACSGKHGSATNVATEESDSATASAAPRLATDSVHWADSLIFGDCRAVIEISGQYPSGGTEPLLDSVRSWLGERMSIRPYTGEASFAPTAAELASGQKLAAHSGETIMEFAKSDFEKFAADNIRISYEFGYSFVPTYIADSVMTYCFSEYVYLGGAHGSSTAYTQSFNCNTGERLTAANVFAADKRNELMALIREGLWEQYFKENAGDGATLRDMLLINPDTMSLPVCPPDFGKEGVSFIYQQYEIACYAAGMPQCTLPYKEIVPFMTDEARRLVEADE